jgi:hypothetical protein
MRQNKGVNMEAQHLEQMGWMLLRNCNLHTIICLPNSVFKPFACVSADLLFFGRVSSPSEELKPALEL